MKELFRETFLGKTLRLLPGHLLRYPEEEPSFIVPHAYLSSDHVVPDTPTQLKGLNYGTQSQDEETGLKDSQGIEMRTKEEEKHSEFVVVDCRFHFTVSSSRLMETLLGYGPTDSENPRNWTSGKKSFVTGVLWCVLAVAQYQR